MAFGCRLAERVRAKALHYFFPHPDLLQWDRFKAQLEGGGRLEPEIILLPVHELGIGEGAVVIPAFDLADDTYLKGFTTFTPP